MVQATSAEEKIKQQEEFDKASVVMATLLGEITSANEDKPILDGLILMLKLVSNIVQKPTEEKFRTVKMTNKTIDAKLFSLKGGVKDLFI